MRRNDRRTQRGLALGRPRRLLQEPFELGDARFELHDTPLRHRFELNDPRFEPRYVPLMLCATGTRRVIRRLRHRSTISAKSAAKHEAQPNRQANQGTPLINYDC